MVGALGRTAETEGRVGVRANFACSGAETAQGPVRQVTLRPFLAQREDVYKRQGETGAIPEGPVVTQATGRIWGPPEALLGTTPVGARVRCV